MNCAGHPECDYGEISCKTQQTSNTTGSGEAGDQSLPEPVPDDTQSHWQIVHIVSITTVVLFALLLTTVVTLVTICVYRFGILAAQVSLSSFSQVFETLRAKT